METAMFDLREIRRAFILAACGTAIVVGLFALFVNSHPISDEAPNALVTKAGSADLADGR